MIPGSEFVELPAAHMAAHLKAPVKFSAIVLNHLDSVVRRQVPVDDAPGEMQPHKRTETDMPNGSGDERYFLQVMMDVHPDHEDEFNRWYDEEHFPERMAVPGFLSGRRLRVGEESGVPTSVAVNRAPKYAAIYEIESPDVLNSEAYATLQVDSDRAKSLVPWISNVYRTVYTEITPVIPAGYQVKAVRR